MRLAPGWWPWALTPATLAVLLLLLAPGQPWAWAAAAGLSLLAVGAAMFFRDPEREPGPGVVSAADGRVRSVEEGKVVVFLNVHDVHVIRAPVAGTVAGIERLPGGHRPAFLEGAKRNAGVAVTLDTAWGLVEVALIAGLVARRAVAWVEPGDEVAKGQRIGIIKFGSRVDVQQVPGTTVQVAPGDRVKAGETTIATFTEERT